MKLQNVLGAHIVIIQQRIRMKASQAINQTGHFFFSLVVSVLFWAGCVCVVGAGWVAGATGAAGWATGAAGWTTGAVGWATGAAGWATGAAGWATGAAGWATGAAGWATGAAGWATGAAGWATGAAGWATGAAGWATGAVWSAGLVGWTCGWVWFCVCVSGVSAIFKKLVIKLKYYNSIFKNQKKSNFGGLFEST